MTVLRLEVPQAPEKVWAKFWVQPAPGLAPAAKKLKAIFFFF